MARPSKKELTFKPYGRDRRGGRWCKVVDGKTRYFGKTKIGRSDRKSYSDAVKKYRQWLDGQERQRALDEMTVDELSDYMRQCHYDMAAKASERTSREAERQQLLEAMSDEQVMDLVRRELGMTNGQSQPRIGKLIDRYIEDYERRHSLTLADDTAVPPKERVSKKHLANVKCDMGKIFRNFCDNIAQRKTFGNELQAERLLTRWREYLIDEKIDENISNSTLNNRLRQVRTFVNWCFRKRYIDAQPRNAADVFRQFRVNPNPKPLRLDIIHRLWAKADPRMRCFIALGLNCAFRGSDIGSLTTTNIWKQNGRTYLAGRRHKTGVPFKIMLWESTAKLLEEERNRDGLLFTTRQGRSVADNDALGQLWADFRDTLNGFDDVTFQQFRDTAATAMERVAERTGNASLTSMLLAHRDQRTARFYVDKNPKEMDSSALDSAIEELESYFGLNADGTIRKSSQATNSAVA